jgi:hypothetical protein
MALLPSVASPMHGAVVPIATIVGDSTSSSVVLQFNNIPQTYQDLMVVFSGFPTNASTIPVCNINNDGSAIYSQTELCGTGVSAFSQRTTGFGSFQYIYGFAPSTTIPFSFTAHILNYANTSTYKTMLWRAANDQNGSGQIFAQVGLYRSTNAISVLNISTSNGGYYWATGSRISLYGIRTINQ